MTRRSVLLPDAIDKFRGMGPCFRRDDGGDRGSYAAAIRRKPFHIAVAAPEVSTGRIRASW
ncbi:hypothetical protein GA0061098_102676 [Bradyrhizobium shewense]|uniref:Uncharacterized protein n=1 Tax=Bradyrhizobium shewense TaxID=1761772 RepID=A0A1C3XQC5_9BRAD|nr:hypothetical protein GA0061098_102676 [Bradyrhizobium shewense]